jgi:uncharacterized protein involved in exopolysaccharide biosynthesis
MVTEPLYESSCIIQIESPRFLGRDLQRVIPGLTERIDTYSLKSRIVSSDYLVQLIDRMGMRDNKLMRGRALAIQATMPDKSIDEIVEHLLIKKLKTEIFVKAVGRESVKITATALTSDLAYDKVKYLTEIFITESQKSQLSTVESAKSFNTEQMMVFKQKLQDAERRLEDFRKGIISSSIDDTKLRDEERSRITEAIVGLGLAIKEKKDQVSFIDNDLPDNQLKQYPKTDRIGTLNRQIDSKILQMAALMKQFSWRSPELIKVNSDINDLNSQIQSLLPTAISSRFGNLASEKAEVYLRKSVALVDLDVLEKKERALTALLDRDRNRSAQDPANELTLSKLEQEVAVNRGIYNMFLEQNQGTQIEQSMQEADASTRFKVIEPAYKPLDSAGTGARMIFMMALVLSTGLGGAAVYLREFMDRSIRTVQEAEDYFQISVIGVIPMLTEADAGASSKKRVFVWAFLGLTVVAVAVAFISWRFL